jgi:uncharacterized membrane protein
MNKQPQTREEEEMAITVVSLAIWGAILLFITAAILFLLGIIPSTNSVLIGLMLLTVAAVNWIVMRVMVGKMHADLDETLK